MPGPHYAISEALIVVAAIWTVFRLTRSGHPLAALGTGILGTAAAIGVYRFGFGNIENLAAFHRDFSQIGGAIAMSLIGSQLLIRHPFLRIGYAGRSLALLGIGGTTVLAFIFPQLTTGLFAGWLVLAMLSAAMFPGHGVFLRILTTGTISLFLVNVLLVRRSTLLGADLSWHAFHILIAIWLIGMIWVFENIQTAQRTVMNMDQNRSLTE